MGLLTAAQLREHVEAFASIRHLDHPHGHSLGRPPDRILARWLVLTLLGPSGDHPAVAATEGRVDLTPAELARAASVEKAFVERLADLALLISREGRYAPSDVYLVRFAALVERSGIELEALAGAVSDGIISLSDIDIVFPDPPVASERTHAELAAELGVDIRALHETRLAAGLATLHADDVVAQDEEHALRSAFLAAQAFGDPTLAIRIARVFGGGAQRMAASVARMYDESVNRAFLESGAVLDVSTSRAISEETRQLMDVGADALDTLFAHHLASATLSLWVQTAEVLLERHGYVPTRPKATSAIAFVDLSGFTRLTDEEGDEVGTRLATELAAEAERAVARHGCRLVKLLGDGVMLQGDDPVALVRTALALVRSLPAHGLPPAHAGVHAGASIERDGDYFGRTVNIAARIAAVARPGEVLVSAAVIEDATLGLEATEVGPRELRGVGEPVRLFRVTE
jgi:adenylate cyclase